MLLHPHQSMALGLREPIEYYYYYHTRGTRQGGGGGLLPLPQTKESKSHSSKHSKSQKHSKSSDGSGGGKTSGHGSRSGGPLSPHSILGAGPGSETSTTRRHNSTGSRMEHSGSGVRSTSITRSNSTAASVSSKSVSPNLSPKSSLSTSSSSGSLKQETESREGVGRGALTSEQQEVGPYHTLALIVVGPWRIGTVHVHRVYVCVCSVCIYWVCALISTRVVHVLAKSCNDQTHTHTH